MAEYEQIGTVWRRRSGNGNGDPITGCLIVVIALFLIGSCNKQKASGVEEASTKAAVVERSDRRAETSTDR